MEWPIALLEKVTDRRTEGKYEEEQKKLRRAMEKLAGNNEAPEDIRRKARCAATHLREMGF